MHLKIDAKTPSGVRFLPLPLLRAVSLLLTLTIVGADPVWATGMADLVRGSFSHDLRDLTVPSKFGTITDKWVALETCRGGPPCPPAIESPSRTQPDFGQGRSPAPTPFVVLIQDLHANIGVQKNIASIIEYLYHRARVGTIYAEAAFGPCDVSLLRTIPSRRAQNRFEKKLLSKALLTGDEMAVAHIGNGPLSPVKLFGIDDPRLYLANVRAFGDLVKVGPEAASDWKSLKELLMPGAAPELRHHLELIEKLLTLKLLDHEWPEYQAHRHWTPQGSPAFKKAVAAAERYYTAAEARNGAMTANLLTQMGEQGSEGARERGNGISGVSPARPLSHSHAPVVLVTGGFHTASIAHLLKRNGISFIVVTPEVENLDQEELYVQSMTEPPHESVRAIVASNYQKLMLKSEMIGMDMESWLPWLSRETIVPRMQPAYAHSGVITLFAHPMGQYSGEGDWLSRLFRSIAVWHNSAVHRTSRLPFAALGASLAGFYVGLSHLSTVLAAIVPHLASAQIGLTLPALMASAFGLSAWLFSFMASVVIPLAALLLVTRFVMMALEGTNFAAKIRSPYQAYHDWVMALKKDHRVTGWLAELPVDLAKTMYGFAFVHSNRLLDIMATNELPKDASLWERRFAALPAWLRPVAFPFFATFSILGKRLMMKAFSTVGQVILVGGLASLLAVASPHHSLGILSHLMNFNLLDPFAALGWHNAAVPWLSQNAVGKAALHLFSVFAMFNSYLMAYLLLVGRRTWEMRKALAQAPDAPTGLEAWLGALKLARQPIEIRNEKGEVVGKTSLWRANFSGALGMHTVGLEIEGLKYLSHGFQPTHALVMKIEDSSGIMGSGEQFIQTALHPFGIDPNQLVAHLPGTHGLTMEQIAQIEPLKQRAQERQATRAKESSPSFAQELRDTFHGWIHPAVVRAQNQPPAPVGQAPVPAGPPPPPQTPAGQTPGQVPLGPPPVGSGLGSATQTNPLMSTENFEFKSWMGNATLAAIKETAGEYEARYNQNVKSAEKHKVEADEALRAELSPPDILKDEARLQLVRDKFDPTKAIRPEVLAARVNTAADKLAAADPAQMIRTIQALRDSVTRVLGGSQSGAMDERLRPMADFSRELGDVLKDLDALRATEVPGQNSLRVENAEPRVAGIRHLLETARALDKMQTDLMTLDQALGASPLIGKEDAAALKADEQKVLLAFSDNRMQYAILSLQDLLNDWVDPTHWTIRKTNADTQLQNLDYQIKDSRAALSEEGKYVPFSDAERHTFARTLQEKVSHLGEETDYRLRFLSVPGTNDGRLRDALGVGHNAFDAVAKVVDVLENNGDWSQDKHQVLTDALHAVEKAQLSWSVFDKSNPDYADALSGLPTSPDTLSPEARASFDAFKASVHLEQPELWTQLTGKDSDVKLMRMWYGNLLEQLSPEYWENMRSLLQSSLGLSEESRDILIQIQRQEADRDANQARLRSLPPLIDSLQKQSQRLEQQREKQEKKAAAARKLAPNVSLEAMLKPTGQDVKDLLAALAPLRKLKVKDKDQGIVLDQAIRDLGNELDALDKATVDPESALDSAQRTQLMGRLLAVSAHFETLINSDYVKLGHGKEKARHTRALQDFMARDIQFQARLSGLSDARLREGLTQDPRSFENQYVMQVLADLPLSVREFLSTKQFTEATLRSSSWLPWKDWYFPVQVANESLTIATGGVPDLALTVAGAITGGVVHLTLTTPPVTPPPVVTAPPGVIVPIAPPIHLQADGLDYYRKIPSPFRVGLGTIDGVVSGIGGTKEIYKGLKGELPDGRYRLDPKIFGHVHAHVIQDRREAPKEGAVYMLSPGGKVLMEIDNKTITAADVPDPALSPDAQKTKMWLLDDTSVLDGGIFTVVTSGGVTHRYVWVGERMSGTERAGHLVKGGLGIGSAVQIGKGLPHDLKDLASDKSNFVFKDGNYYERVTAKANPLDRVLAASYLIGVVTNAKDIANAVRFKLLSRHGGYMDAKSPKFIQDIETTDSRGNAAHIKVDEHGDFYVVREDAALKKTYLDRMDGTVVGQLTPHHGVGRLLSLLRIRSNFETYIDASDAVRASLLNLTEAHGRFVPDRQGSSPMTFTKAAGPQDKDTLEVLEGLEWVKYELGKEVTVPIQGRPTTVRPYYSLNDPLKAVRGVVVTANGQPLAGKDGAVRSDSVYVYLNSDPEKFESWNALVSEGKKLDLGSVQGTIALSSMVSEIQQAVDANPQGRWDTDLDGTARFTVPDAEGRENVLFTISQNEAALDILDSRLPGQEKTYRLTESKDNKQTQVAVGAVSLSGLAKTAALAPNEKGVGGQGQLFRLDPIEGTVPPQTRLLAATDAPEAALYWDRQTQAWKVNVKTPGSIFDQAGNWGHEPGVEDIRESEVGLNDAFEWDQRLPLVPDFEKEFNPLTDAKEIRTLSDGTSETRYFFHQVDTDKDRGPLLGTFIVRTDKDHHTSAFQVADSLPGLKYKEQMESGNALAIWELRGSLPTESGQFHWVTQGAAVPQAIADQLRAQSGSGNAALSAAYAQDPLTDDFFLKVTVRADGSPERVYTFHNKMTSAGNASIAEAKRSQARAYASLPEGIPDDLIYGLAAFQKDPDSFRKDPATGLWQYREASVPGTAEYAQHLETGGAIVMGPGVTLDILRDKFKLENKTLVPGTRGAGDTIEYGGAQFHSHIIYADPDAPQKMPAVIVLQAAENTAAFRDPQVDPAQAPQTLAAGQIVIINPSQREINGDKSRWTQPIERWVPIFMSPAELIARADQDTPEHPVLEAGAPQSSMRSFFGQGADSIKGQFFIQDVMVKGVLSRVYYFQADAAGGTFTDPDPKVGSVRFEPGGMYVLEATPVVDQKTIDFHEGTQQAITASPLPVEALSIGYWQDSLERQLPPNGVIRDPIQTFIYRDPETHQEVLVDATKTDPHADPYAPTGFLIHQRTAPGPTATTDLHDAIRGITIHASPEDLMMRQVPLKYREKVDAYLKEHPNTAALVEHDDGTFTPIEGPFDSPDYGGIIPVKEMETRLRPNNLPDETLVRVKRNGELDGVVVLLPPAMRELSSVYSGFGMIQVIPGENPIVINGRSYIASGWIHILDSDTPTVSPETGRLTGVPYVWARDHLHRAIPKTAPKTPEESDNPSWNVADERGVLWGNMIGGYDLAIRTRDRLMQRFGLLVAGAQKFGPTDMGEILQYKPIPKNKNPQARQPSAWINTGPYAGGAIFRKQFVNPNIHKEIWETYMGEIVVRRQFFEQGKLIKTIYYDTARGDHFPLREEIKGTVYERYRNKEYDKGKEYATATYDNKTGTVKIIDLYDDLGNWLGSYNPDNHLLQARTFPQGMVLGGQQQLNTDGKHEWSKQLLQSRVPPESLGLKKQGPGIGYIDPGSTGAQDVLDQVRKALHAALDNNKTGMIFAPAVPGSQSAGLTNIPMFGADLPTPFMAGFGPMAPMMMVMSALGKAIQSFILSRRKKAQTKPSQPEKINISRRRFVQKASVATAAAGVLMTIGAGSGVALPLPQGPPAPVTAPAPAAPAASPQFQPLTALQAGAPARGFLVTDNQVPLFHVSRSIQIDSFYVAQPPDALGNVFVLGYRLDTPIVYDPNVEPVITHNRLREYLANQQATYFESRTYDDNGLLRWVGFGGANPYNPDYVTQHDYLEGTKVLQHSRLTFKGNIVNGQVQGGRTYWDVFYPQRRTFDDALLGMTPQEFRDAIPRDLWDTIFPAGMNDQARAAAVDKWVGWFQSAGLARNQPGDTNLRHGFGDLPPAVASALAANQLDKDSVLQPAVVVRDNGAINVDYRWPDDPAEQLIMTDHGADRSITSSWDEFDYVSYAYKVSATKNQVMAEYETLGYQVAAQVVPSQLLAAMKTIGITGTSKMPVVREKVHPLLGNVHAMDDSGRPLKTYSGEEGQIVFAEELDYSTDPKAMVLNTMWYAPNYLGVPVKVDYQWNGGVINHWERTGEGNVPLGILPGSTLLDKDGFKVVGTKKYKGEGTVTLPDSRDPNRAPTTYRTYSYEISDQREDKKEQREEAYEASSGHLISRTYDWVRLRLANVYPVARGSETIYYDPTGHAEIPMLGVGTFEGKTRTTKQLIRTDFVVDGKNHALETQIWRELEPLLGKRWQTWTRRFRDGQVEMPIQEIVSDFTEEWKQTVPASSLMHGLEVAAGALGLIWVAGKLGLRRDLKKEDERQVERIGSPEPPAVEAPPETEEEIQRILKSIGVEDGGNYTVLNNVLTQLGEPASAGEPFAKYQPFLDRWREKTGRDHGAMEDKLALYVLIEWITQEMNRGGAPLAPAFGLAGIADLPTLILYQLDKSIGMYNDPAQRGHIAITVRGEVDALRGYIFKEYGRGGLREDKVTFDDLIDFFESKNFLDRYEAVPDKALFYRDLSMDYSLDELNEPDPAREGGITRLNGLIVDHPREFKGLVLSLEKADADALAKHREQVLYQNELSRALPGGFSEAAQAAVKKWVSVQKAREAKTFHDKLGYWQMFKNLLPVILVVFTPVLWVIIDSLLAQLGPAYAGTLLHQMFGGLMQHNPLRLTIASLAFAGWMGGLLFLARKTHKFMDSVSLKQIGAFLVYYPLFLGIWGLFSYFLNFRMWEVFIAFWHLGLLWTAYLGVPTAYIAWASTVLGVFATPVAVGVFFIYYRLKRSGMGQVKSWPQAVRKFSRFKRRFVSLMLPQEVASKWRDRNKEEIFQKFWTQFIEKHLWSDERQEYLITPEEKAALLAATDLQSVPKLADPEAEWRVKRAINSFLMWMPHAPAFNDMEGLTAMVTAFDEKVTWKFNDLNATEPGGEVRRLNKVISVYPDQYLIFLRTLDDPAILPDAAVRPAVMDHLRAHARAVAQGDRLARLDENLLPDAVKLRIETWVSSRMMPMSKTIREVAVIRDAFIFFAWINNPELNMDNPEDRAQLEAMVDKKLQILVNYEGFGFTTDEQKQEVEKLMRQYPFVEVWYRGTTLKKYNPETGTIQDIARSPFGGPAPGPASNPKDLGMKGKPFGQNSILPFAQHRKIIFFDVNASIRWEEAIKIPNAMAEFRRDPKLQLVLFGENIYNRPYNWMTNSFALGEETWTQDEQEALSMFGALGFYGHSAIIDRDALILAGGFPHGYSGEDTILAIRFYEAGFRTTHRLYALFGKSREGGFFATLVAVGRWSQNTAEYFLTRSFTRLIRSGTLHFAQLLIMSKSLSFYSKKEHIPPLNNAYIGWIVFLGVSGYLGMPLGLLLGFLGLLNTQTSALPAWGHLIINEGFLEGTARFIADFPKINASYSPVIPPEGQRFYNATAHGQAGFAISAKGYSLNHYSLEEIWGDGIYKWRLPTLWLAQVVLSVSAGMMVMLLPQNGRLVGLIALTFGIDVFWHVLSRFNSKVRADLYPEDATKRSAVKEMLMVSVKQIVAIALALWLWGGIPVTWPFWLAEGTSLVLYVVGSFSENKWVRRIFIPVGFAGTIASIWLGTKLASPMFLLVSFSLFYLSIPFTSLLVPLIGHARPFLLLKIRPLIKYTRQEMQGFFFDQEFVIPAKGKAPEYRIRMNDPIGKGPSGQPADPEPLNDVVFSTLLTVAETLHIQPLELLQAVRNDPAAQAGIRDTIGNVLINFGGGDRKAKLTELLDAYLAHHLPVGIAPAPLKGSLASGRERLKNIPAWKLLLRIGTGLLAAAILVSTWAGFFRPTPKKIPQIPRAPDAITLAVPPPITTVAPVNNVQLVRNAAGEWVWPADGKPLETPEGVVYQPSGFTDILYYITEHRLDVLYGHLASKDEIDGFRKYPLFSAYTGTNTNDQDTAKKMGFNSIRIYQAPLDDELEIRRFKEVMRASGLQVFITQNLGEDDQSRVKMADKDRAWMRGRLDKLASIYGNEPWVMGFGIGNEADLKLKGVNSGGSIQLTPDNYYRLMDEMAGYLKQQMNSHGYHRPVLLGHGYPKGSSYARMNSMRYVDGFTLNVYPTSPGELDAVLAGVNPRYALVIGEYGQLGGTSNLKFRAQNFAWQRAYYDSHRRRIAGRFAFEFTDEPMKGISGNLDEAHMGLVISDPRTGAITGIKKGLENTFTPKTPAPASANPPPAPAAPTPAPAQPIAKLEEMKEKAPDVEHLREFTATFEQAAAVKKPDAGSSKGKGVHGPEEHAAVNQVIEEARQEGRGRVVQGTLGDKWGTAQSAETSALQAALSLLDGYPEITLAAGLGTVRLMDVLPGVNILLVDPKNGSPGLYVKNKDAYQVSHVDASLNAIVIDSLTYQHLAPAELAALIVHDVIDLVSKQRTLARGETWAVESADLAHQTAEIQEQGFLEKVTGNRSQLDQAIERLLFGGPEAPVEVAHGFYDGDAAVQWPTPLRIAHRAESMKDAVMAVQLGLRILETDVQMTKDGKLIALWGLVKTPAGDKHVCDLTKAEIDAALGKTTLDVEDLFKFVEDKNIVVFLDTKDWSRDVPGYTERFIDRLAQSIREHKLADRVMSSAFSEYPQRLHKKIPGLLVGRGITPNELKTFVEPSKWLELAQQGVRFITLDSRILTHALIDEIHAAGLLVATSWNPDKKDLMGRVDMIWADDYNALAAFQTNVERTQQLKASKGFARLKGIAGFGPVLTPEAEFFSLNGHLRRTAFLARELSAKYGTDADRAEFIALAHSYAELPFRFYGVRGALAGALKEAQWNEKQALVEKLERDGISLTERTKTDLLHFDITKAGDLSEDAKVALIAESIEGLVEDVLFFLKIGRVTLSEIDPTLIEQLGINRMPDFPARLQNGFDDLVYKVARQVIGEESGSLEDFLLKARSLKQEFRQKFLEKSIRPAEENAVDRVSTILAPVYEHIVDLVRHEAGYKKEAEIHRIALTRLTEMTDLDVLQEAVRLGTINEEEIKTYQQALSIRNVLRPRRSIVLGAMESEFNFRGGQADYMKDLSHALARRGHRVTVIAPNFGKRVKGTKVARINVPMGGGVIPLDVIRVVDVKDPTLTHLLLEDPDGELYQGLYQDPEGLRGLIESAVLSKAIQILSERKDLISTVDIIHTNDWQTGLTPVYMNQTDPAKPSRGSVLPAQLTVRNGQSYVDLQSLLGVRSDTFHRARKGLEFYSRVNLMKGMALADVLTGVSEGNLEELTEPEKDGGTAFGLDGVVREMREEGKLSAVFNGGDVDPSTDPYLKDDGYTNFSEHMPREELLARKAQNKRALIKEIKSLPGAEHFEATEKDIIVGTVGRISEQKGLDVLVESVRELMASQPAGQGRIKVLVFGKPDKDDKKGQEIARQLEALAREFPVDVYVQIGFAPDSLVSRLYAGMDAFVMPSLHEPGGIANQKANKYGTPVIAPLTGGLKDFFHEWRGVGFAFDKFRESQKDKAARDLTQTIRRAAKVYWSHPSAWAGLVLQSTRYKAAWDDRVEKYEEDIYEPAIARARARGASAGLVHIVHNMEHQGIFDRELKVDPRDPLVQKLQRRPAASSQPRRPTDAYRPFYDGLRTNAGRVRAIQESDLERSRLFLGADGKLKSRNERHANGTFGITEVFFLPVSEARRKMAAFQRALKDRFGDKVYLVDEDKLHMTFQGLERQWDDKSAGTKKSYAMHDGLNSIRPDVGPLASVRKRARAIGTDAIDMQVARVNWDPTLGIVFEVRPRLADPAHDPVMLRRAAWDLPQPFPPHITAAYFAQPFDEKELSDLRALVEQYQNTFGDAPFGDIEVNEAQVIAYEDLSFNAGYKVLETTSFLSPASPSTVSGALGIWKKWFGWTSLPWIGFVEGVLIVSFLSLPVWGLMPQGPLHVYSLWIQAVTQLPVEMVFTVAVISLLFITRFALQNAHYKLGVARPDGQVVLHNASLSKRAANIASSSLVGLLFAVPGIMSTGAVALSLITIGVLFGGMVHAFQNWLDRPSLNSSMHWADRDA